MECNSLSALLSAANRENTASLKERNGECIGACVRGWEPSPRLRLWMSQKQSVGMPTDFSPFLCSSLSLVWGCRSNPITKALLRRSGVPTWGGSVNWKTPLLNTEMTTETSLNTWCRASSKSAKGFSSIIFSDLDWCCDSPTGVHLQVYPLTDADGNNVSGKRLTSFLPQRSTLTACFQSLALFIF